VTAVAPSLNVDPFSDAFLADPYPDHERLRAAGPVVWLETYGIYASARHAEVQEALQDWRTFSSAAGVGLANIRKEAPFFRPPSLVLEADPPLHDRTRPVLGLALSPAALRDLRPQFEAEARALADELVARGSFDGVTDLAEVYPIRVFADALGLRDEGREHLLPYAAFLFNAFGPRNARFEATLRAGRRRANG
jgi:cytochrome P450